MIPVRYTKGEGENAVKKPLHECTVEECFELKTTLFDKYQKLASIGKGALAMNFAQMLQQVDERIQFLQLEEMKAEAAKAKAKQDEARVKSGAPPRKTSHDRNRWTASSASLD